VVVVPFYQVKPQELPSIIVLNVVIYYVNLIMFPEVPVVVVEVDVDVIIAGIVVR
jgi:hypothetical protein